MATECSSCAGRGWKYASPRRGVIAQGSGETVTAERVTVACLGCMGAGLVSAEAE
jgi:DnaJ-class molecular chaperone